MMHVLAQYVRHRHLAAPKLLGQKSFDIWPINPSVRCGALALIAPRSVGGFCGDDDFGDRRGGLVANTPVDSI
jgi:hypothetical protein